MIWHLYIKWEEVVGPKGIQIHVRLTKWTFRRQALCLFCHGSGSPDFLTTVSMMVLNKVGKSLMALGQKKGLWGNFPPPQSITYLVSLTPVQFFFPSPVSSTTLSSVPLQLSRIIQVVKARTLRVPCMEITNQLTGPFQEFWKVLSMNWILWNSNHRLKDKSQFANMLSVGRINGSISFFERKNGSKLQQTENFLWSHTCWF